MIPLPFHTEFCSYSVVVFSGAVVCALSIGNLRLPPIDAAQVVYVLWRRQTLSAEHSFNRISASSMAAVIRNGRSYSFSRRCEVRSVIKFFNAQSIAPIEIHRQLCQVYGPKIMSKQMVRRWCRQFSEGRQSVHDEERSGRSSLINDDRVDLVRQ
ncbi:hypothetical protein ANN_13198 [Periplaneta americana]|uniref:Mos1 transposase HTH domain-containing protein n=1 Tax=Periplaneta americana TaxID=6978 RepID=A0ABQ8TJ51_PERAM|nr:hypothetical protein ANN_13198 [Periplaneta americana]